MREVRTIRQKIDNPTRKALSQPRKLMKTVETVGNSIHYFTSSLKESEHKVMLVHAPYLINALDLGRVLTASTYEKQMRPHGTIEFISIGMARQIGVGVVTRRITMQRDGHETATSLRQAVE